MEPKIAFPEEASSGIRATILPPSRGRAAHPALRPVVETIARIAPFHCAVLVTGESGTGAELLAAAVHDSSPTRDAALVLFHCDTDSDLEHAIARAHGGTLFLEDVHALPLASQTKLLSVLDHVRVIASTSANLSTLVVAGRFRSDLFYRLSVVTIDLQPLRKRNDIELLAQAMLRNTARRIGRSDVTGFSKRALACLREHAWPGNVRELENAIERALLMAAGPLIEDTDLPDRVRGVGPCDHVSFDLPRQGIDLKRAVDAYETSLVKQALERTNGNKHQAARLLNMRRTTLVEMIKRKKL